MDHPYTKVNPYRASPLTALVIFRTDKAAKVSYTVVGKSAKTSITNTVNGGYQRVHQVPVVGLYADYANQVKIKVTYRSQTTTKNLDPPNREITENAQPGRYQGHQIRSK